jgi:hypothetical protein
VRQQGGKQLHYLPIALLLLLAPSPAHPHDCAQPFAVTNQQKCCNCPPCCCRCCSVEALSAQAGTAQWSTQQAQQLLGLTDAMELARGQLLNIQLEQQLMHTRKVWISSSSPVSQASPAVYLLPFVPVEAQECM